MANSNELDEEEYLSLEEIQKKEKEELEKMSEVMKKAYYAFKSGFAESLEKTLKEKKLEQKEIKEALDEIDYIEVFYESMKQEETEACLEVIYKNCISVRSVHNMAYELNEEYKILWDNLDEKAKKNALLAHKMDKVSQNVEKARWGVVTLGLSVLASKSLQKRQDEKIKEYVLSEGFTHLCSVCNTNLNNYKKEAEKNGH